MPITSRGVPSGGFLLCANVEAFQNANFDTTSTKMYSYTTAQLAAEAELTEKLAEELVDATDSVYCRVKQ